MLVLERQREAVDYAAQNFEELRDSVMPLGLVDEAVERVVDLLADGGAQTEELAVDAMQHGLEEVALAWVLAVEESEELECELRVERLLGQIGLKVRRLEEAQEELVDELEMWPGRVQHRLVELGTGEVGGRGQASEHVSREHAHALLVDSLRGQDAACGCQELDELVQRLSLHLLGLEVTERVYGEVKAKAALTQLLAEELLSFDS